MDDQPDRYRGFNSTMVRLKDTDYPERLIESPDKDEFQFHNGSIKSLADRRSELVLKEEGVDQLCFNSTMVRLKARKIN